MSSPPIWTYDIVRGRLSKLTDDPQINLGPVWTPDSQQGNPTTVFEGSYASYLGGLPFRAYDVTPDGKRFIMIKELAGSTGAADTSQLNVVLNWSGDLKRH